MTEPNRPPRLLLLDGHSLAYRAFFALPVENFSTATGQNTNAVYGFTSMLVNVLRDEQPTHVAVAFDLSRQTFRLEEYSEYKAKRNKTPGEFSSQLPLIQRMLDTFSIKYLTAPGYEADDIIATLVTQALADETAGLEVLILTGDRDSLQLVTERSTVLYPMRGVSDLARMTPAAVEEKYGVPPHRYPELAAIVGETSDNLPGVPGVGAGFAARWINTYDGLDNVIAQADKITGKKGEAFREHLGDVIRNRRLNALVRDLDLGVAMDDLVLTEWDRAAALELLDELEFRGELRTRILDVVAPAEDIPVEAGVDLDGTTLAPDAVAGWLDAVGDQTVGLSVRGSWGSGTGRVSGLAFALAEGTAAYIDVEAMSQADDAAVAGWLADAAKPKVLHDAKGPLHALAAQGWTLAGVVEDTALAAYLVAPDQRSYDLADLTLRYLHRELTQNDDPDQGELLFDEGGTDQGGVASSAMVQARAALDLSAELADEVEKAGGRGLLTDVELPLVRVLAGLEQTGIAVDTEHLEGLEAHFGDEVRKEAEAAYAVIGKEINLGSPKQLQVVLFDELNMPKTKRTKTGYTTDADALQSLFVQTEHPFLLHLLRHREVIRLRQTIEGLLKTVQPDGRIHTTFHQTIAATGRLSSTEPNLQNIPVRTEEGRRIRESFVVGAGYDSLMTADYSQIEMRIMAHLSEDELLIEAFRSGRDFHAETASRVFDVEPDAVTPEMRAKIKAMNYGLAYGLSAFGLSQQLGIEPGEARGLMDDYFETFGGIRDYLGGVVDEARRTGFTETIMGRRRYLPDLTSDNRMRRESAERMALNAPIQGSAADLIKVAMLRTDAALREAGLTSRMLLQVHDELVFEVAAGEADVLEKLVREQMAGAAELTVPLDVSVGTGRSWHEAAH
ncbi:DNA polymerase I [Pimelobacter simplex]|uniref:DNA polymerase I n=1 Tax=Nocardioides simplex TaxID=2045 RepID=A0A0A1DIU1_NOCSI|nr:DNA polymerase I [Pimelobacter simplex]AIY17244.1 DNA polymerase I [Pimelobacter simplex]MCG8151551.1 DNA polymerase I [Pimelobacter simplex]GEB13266.1 DNA polymerase [Pimelobacter simplex]SFM47240.1 DNA polymerase I [Pimelobacter simplex]